MVETIWWDNRTHSLYPSRKLQLLTLLLYFINKILEIWESNVFTFFISLARDKTILQLPTCCFT